MKKSMKTLSKYFIAAVLWAAWQPAELVAATDVASQIQSVVVYPEGAMVNRSVKVQLKNGLNEVKVPLLTPLLDQKSVRVGVKNGNATLLGVKYDVEVPGQKEIGKVFRKLSERASVLRDSIDIYQYKHDVLEKERELLLKNNNIGGTQGFTASTLQGVASYVRTDMTNIITLQYNYTKQIDRLQDELTVCEQQMNLQAEKQMDPKSLLLVTLDAASAGSCELELQYYVEEASWMPFYEVRISKQNDALHLVKKAYVSQGSREAWNDVALSLSQNNPTISSEMPVLGRYSLPYHEYSRSKKNNEKAYVKVLGIVRNEKAPLKGALVEAGDDFKTQTDENGYYELLVPDRTDVKFSYKNIGTANYWVSAMWNFLTKRGMWLNHPKKRLILTI